MKSKTKAFILTGLLFAFAANEGATFAQGTSTQAVLSFEQSNFVDMPIWVYVKFPTEEQSQRANLRYPFSGEPWSFGLYDFEVTRDGKPLEKLPVARLNFSMGGLVGGSAAPPSSPKNRLPLHLHYGLDKSGSYLVRLVKYDFMDFEKKKPEPLSEWTKLEIRAGDAKKRQAWLKETVAHPPKDNGKIVGDFLPSLLAKPDAEVLPTVLEYIHHPDAQDFAVYSLWCFDDAMVKREIPLLIRKKGATDFLAHYLTWRRDLFQPVAHEIADSLIPFLKSKSATEVGGTLRALGFMYQGYFSWKEHPEIPEKIEKAAADALPHILSFREREVLQPLCLMAQVFKPDQRRDLLRRLSAEGSSTREQALICLPWCKDARDLPYLEKALYDKDGAGSSLPYQMRKAYGRDALPILIKAMKAATDRRTRVECAKELALENEPEAFAFFRWAIEQEGYYREQTTQIIRDHFEGQREKSAEDISKFLDEKIHSQSRDK
jgi:hypothetical protein